jgi:nitroreductase
MQFFDVVEARRSVRAFTAEPIATDKLEVVLATARMAPSAGDLQAYRIVVIDEAKAKAALAAAAHGQDFISEAAIVLVFCADPGRSEGKYGHRGVSLYCIQDATIAASYAQLAATAEGLASCWVGAFDEERVARVLRTPARLRPVTLMPLGYAAEAPQRPARRPLEALVHRGTW